MKLKATVLASAVFAMSGSVTAETVKIASGDWEPYLGSTLPAGGPVAKAVSKAFKTQGWTVVYEYFPWKRGYENVKSGDIDASIVWSRNDERAADVDFSEPVITLSTVVFYAKKSPVQWSAEEDLMGLKIGGVVGYDYSFVNEDNGYNLERIAGAEANYRKLASGRLDIVLDETMVGRNLAKKAGVLEDVAIADNSIKSKPYFLISGKANPRSEKILEVFNKGLAELKDSGHYDDIIGQ